MMFAMGMIAGVIVSAVVFIEFVRQLKNWVT